MTLRGTSRIRGFGALLAAAVLMLAADVLGAEIRGTVTAVAGDTITVVLESDLRPAVGDRMEISYKTSDDQIAVGTWKVNRVDGRIVTGTVVEADGEATVDMIAVVFSASPTRAAPPDPSRQPAAPLVRELPPGGGAGGWLGARVGDAHKVMGIAGAYIHEIVDAAPAHAAGLKSGDVITGFDGREVGSARQLVELVRGVRPGTRVTLIAVYDKRRRTVVVTIGRRPR